MICLNCKTELSTGGDYEFCPECGNSLREKPTESSITKICECGQDLSDEGDDFCSNCGTKIRITTQAATTFANKTIIAATGAFALVAIAAIVILFAFRSYNPPYEVISIGRYDAISYIGDNRFLVLRGSGANARWGVEDIRGNEIIVFGRYDFLDDEFLTHDGNFIVRDGRIFFILDSRGREITSFDRYDRVSYVTSNRFIVSTGTGTNTRAGVVDARGNEIISLGRFTHIAASEGGRWYTVWDGNRVGVLNDRGNEVVSIGRYDHITIVPGDRIIVSVGDWANRRWAVLDSRGQEIITLGRYDEISVAGDSVFFVREGNRWGVLDARGNEVVPFRYDSIHMVGENNFVARDGNRWSVLDLRGNEIIPPGRYDGISYALNGRFLVRSNDRFGVLDARGNEVIPLGRYDEIIPVPGDRFIVGSGTSGSRRWGVVDARGNEIISLGRYDSVTTFEWQWFSDDVDYGFIVRTGDRVGAVGLDGQEIIPLGRYDRIIGIYNRLAIVERDGRVGVINTRRIG